MKFKKLKNSYYEAIKLVDDEVLHNNNGRRPYIILVDLMYHDEKQTFAVPCRSNIKDDAPAHTYFPLPRRYKTRDGNRHGLHYIKIIPVHRKLTENVQMHDNSEMYLRIIEKNKDIIKEELQRILDNYCAGIKEKYCTNLEVLFPVYEEYLEKEKAYDKLKISLKPHILKDGFLSVNNISDITPENYVFIKNGCFKNFNLTFKDIKNHATLTIYAENDFKQTKFININVFIKNVEEKKNTNEMFELEESKSK